MVEASTIKHVAIIMDGNGRWANQRAHARVWGHIRGSSVVRGIVEEADDLGLEALTLYAFSTENFCRPVKEVNTLFNLLKKFLLKEKERIIKNKVRFKIMGDISKLPEATKKLIDDLENETKDFNGLKLTFAFGYGGRTEIITAANQFHKEHPNEELTEENLQKYLFVNDLGDVDLLIRTGGDHRISNFLLWQVAYAELYFTSTQWPVFSRSEFKKIILEVSGRERRFGAVESQQSLKESVKIAEQNKRLLESQIRS